MRWHNYDNTMCFSTTKGAIELTRWAYSWFYMKSLIVNEVVFLLRKKVTFVWVTYVCYDFKSGNTKPDLNQLLTAVIQHWLFAQGHIHIPLTFQNGLQLPLCLGVNNFWCHHCTAFHKAIKNFCKICSSLLTLLPKWKHPSFIIRKKPNCYHQSEDVV